MTTKQHIGSKLTAGIALLAVAAAENVSAADSVSADSSGYSLEEVVVTANKRGNQTLQDVGSSIGVIGAAELEKRGVTEFIDITRNVAGLNVIDTGPGQKVFMVRGLVGAGESTVGLYYDDMPTSGSGESAAVSSGRQTDLMVYDADHVEVLRGPQSTLYGSSALAGVVRVLTRQPDASAFAAEVVADGSVTAKGDPSSALKAMINLPVIDDKLAVRLVGYKAHDGGFIDNPYLNRQDVNSVDIKGFRAGIKAMLSPATSLTGQLFMQDLDAADQPISRPFNATVGTTGFPAVGWLNNDARTLQPRIDHTLMAGVTLQHNFELLDLTVNQSYFLRNNTDLADTSFNYAFFTFLQSIDEFPPIPLFRTAVFRSQQETEMSTTEARVATRFGGPFNGVFGLLYSNRTIDLDNSFLETNPSDGVVNTSIPIWYKRTAAFELKQLAAFGELTWDVNDRLSLLGGARVFNNKRLDTGKSVVPFLRLLGSPGPAPTVRSDETKAIFKAQATFKVTDDAMVYGSFSQGYRAGGTVVQVVPELPESYDPDYTNNFELGAKTQWLDNRLQLNAAVYRINWYDMQISGDFFNGAFSGVLNCSGLCAHSQGIELDVTARPVRGLTLGLAATAFKAELNKAQPAVNGSPAAGTQLQQTPDFTVSGSVGYTWELGNGLEGSFNVDAYHNGGTPVVSYRPAYNAGGEAYTLVNASTSIARSERWDLKLYVRNLFDQRAALNTQTDSVTPSYVYTSRPRSVGLQVTLRGN